MPKIHWLIELHCSGELSFQIKLNQGNLQKMAMSALRLLKIPAEHAEKLQALKQFYPLTVDIPEPPNANSLELWMLIGSPAEQSDRTPQHASLTMNAIFATIRSHHTHAGLDYVDLDMDTGFTGIPRDFFGMSGGGFWSVVIYESDNGELRWIPTLVGMACWQLEIVNNIRRVRCLGAQSIRTLISTVESSNATDTM